MPTYEYECQSCHQRVEAVQRFHDPALTTCDACGGDLRKVFSAVGIVFKGSGFYKNDNRSTSTTATAGASASPATTTDTASPAPASTPASTTSAD